MKPRPISRRGSHHSARAQQDRDLATPDTQRFYPRSLLTNARKTNPPPEINPTALRLSAQCPAVTRSTRPLITQSRVEAFSASALRLVVWLFGAIVRFGWSDRGVRLREALNFAERLLERIIFIKAIAAHGPAPQRPRTRRPRFAPPGFRRVATNQRFFYKGARIRARKAGALARVLALIEALTFPERAMRHFLRKIKKGLRLSRIVLVAPPNDALARDALCAALRAMPDTS